MIYADAFGSIVSKRPLQPINLMGSIAFCERSCDEIVRLIKDTDLDSIITHVHELLWGDLGWFCFSTKEPGDKKSGVQTVSRAIDGERIHASAISGILYKFILESVCDQLDVENFSVEFVHADKYLCKHPGSDTSINPYLFIDPIYKGQSIDGVGAVKIISRRQWAFEIGWALYDSLQPTSTTLKKKAAVLELLLCVEPEEKILILKEYGKIALASGNHGIGCCALTEALELAPDDPERRELEILLQSHRKGRVRRK
jgi:hypothetical protein